MFRVRSVSLGVKNRILKDSLKNSYEADFNKRTHATTLFACSDPARIFLSCCCCRASEWIRDGPRVFQTGGYFKERMGTRAAKEPSTQFQETGSSIAIVN